MKSIYQSLTWLFILVNTGLFAQYGNNTMQGQRRSMRQQQGQTQTQNRRPEKPLFVVYNSETVFKKIKLRDKSKIKKLGKILENYNNKIIEIKAFESGSLTMAKSYIKQKMMEAKQSGDPSIMQVARVRFDKIIAPLHKKIKTQQDLLNLNFQKELSPKQYGKWLKFQKIKMRPKQSEANSNPKHKPSQRRGMGSRNY